MTARDGQAFPDTLVGTDSHTTMVNGLGVLGWGVGGIEAEAAMLGQPVSMLLPQVVGFRLEGELPEGVDRHRPRAHRHRDAARARRGGQVRGVLRARPGQPAAGRPRHDRQHVAGVRLHLRDLPGGRRDAALPGVHAAARPSRSSWWRPTRRSRASSTTRAPRTPPTPTRSSSTCRRSSPAWRAPSARRTGWRSRTRPRDFLAELADQAEGKNGDHGGNGSRRDLPGQRPAVLDGGPRTTGRRRARAPARRRWPWRRSPRPAPA